MSDWTSTRLGDTVEFIKNGTTATQLKIKSPKLVTRIETIADGEVNLRKAGFVAESENIERYRLTTGDILFSHINSIKHIGKTALIRSDDEIYNGMNLLQIRPNRARAYSSFLLEVLRSEGFRSEVRSRAKQAVNQASISIAQLQELEILLPPLPEQKKIAEILSGIDKQILSVKSEIQQAQKISTAVTKELIASIQDESLPLSEVAINHDSTRVPIKSEERARRKGPYRYYGASGVIDTIDDFLFDGDYILVGEDGANIIDRNKPLAFKVSGKFWVNNHAHIIQPRESCDINFLTYYLESLDYTGIASGSAQPKITRSALDAIQVPVPALEVQKKIGVVIESTIDMATTAEKKEKKLIDLKQALSADLLSGHKRVSV